MLHLPISIYSLIIYILSNFVLQCHSWHSGSGIISYIIFPQHICPAFALSLGICLGIHRCRLHGNGALFRLGLWHERHREEGEQGLI
jgi:hypothetical protein